MVTPSSTASNSKWSTGSWDAFGHITGAYRIDERLNIANLKNLDPSTTMITSCYTGQTSDILVQEGLQPSWSEFPPPQHAVPVQFRQAISL